MISPSTMSQYLPHDICRIPHLIQHSSLFMRSCTFSHTCSHIFSHLHTSLFTHPSPLLTPPPPHLHLALHEKPNEPCPTKPNGRRLWLTSQPKAPSPKPHQQSQQQQQFQQLQEKRENPVAAVDRKNRRVCVMVGFVRHVFMVVVVCKCWDEGCKCGG